MDWHLLIWRLQPREKLSLTLFQMQKSWKHYFLDNQTFCKNRIVVAYSDSKKLGCVVCFDASQDDHFLGNTLSISHVCPATAAQIDQVIYSVTSFKYRFSFFVSLLQIHRRYACRPNIGLGASTAP